MIKYSWAEVWRCAHGRARDKCNGERKEGNCQQHEFESRMKDGGRAQVRRKIFSMIFKSVVNVEGEVWGGGCSTVAEKILIMKSNEGSELTGS